jgi:Tannase and feruloyl esterase
MAVRASLEEFWEDVQHKAGFRLAPAIPSTCPSMLVVRNRPRQILTVASYALLLATLVQGQALHAAASCESLSSLALSNTTITLAQAVSAGEFTQPASATDAAQKFDNLPAFCRIAATIKPTSDSNIRMDLWMPAAGWNGNLEGIGNGGFAGRMFYDDMAEALGRGYATASTDTGHVGNNGAWAPGHPELVADFGYRGPSPTANTPGSWKSHCCARCFERR